jgi:hypothetical protein
MTRNPLSKPLLPLIAGGQGRHLKTVEAAAGATAGFVGVEFHPFAEIIGTDVSTPVGTGGTVAPIAGNFACHMRLSF